MNVKTACVGIGIVLGSLIVDAQEAPSVKVGARFQGWYQAVEGAAPDGSTANDFVIRRAYVYLNGTLPTQHVSFFAHVAGDRVGQQGLDNPGLGLGTGIAVRDAWVAREPTPAFRVQAGRMLVRGHDLKTTTEWCQIDRCAVGKTHALTVQVQVGI